MSTKSGSPCSVTTIATVETIAPGSACRRLIDAFVSR